MSTRRLARLALAALAVVPIVGCDDDATTGTGGASSATTTSSASSGSSMSTGASSSSSSGGACAPPMGCAAPVKDCIGYADNSSQTKFGLRMTWLDLLAPKSLDTPILKNVIEGGAAAMDLACNLNGGGNFVWLMEFDTASGTLRTGGAKPVSPSAGFAFTDEMVPTSTGMIHVQPTTIVGVTPDAQGAFSSTTDAELALPVYLDQSASQSLLIPMRRLHFTMGALSSDKNCIGHYNAAGLDPENLCFPDDVHPAFLQGGAVEAVIVLEDADQIVIDALHQTLCVLLSGDANTYGMPSGPNTVCKRTVGVIDFKGDACSSAGGCNDAVKFSATYAASSVKIN